MTILHDQPNPEMTSYEFRACLVGHQALWGNAYAEIERSDAGINGLWPLRPDRMTVSRDEANNGWFMSTACRMARTKRFPVCADHALARPVLEWHHRLFADPAGGGIGRRWTWRRGSTARASSATTAGRVGC